MDRNLEEECPICFDINGHNECIIVDCCDKYIHKDCIDQWLTQNINNNKITENKCIYCHRKNNYIDDFINKNNNHQIINIHEQIENSRIVEANVTITQSIEVINCYKCVFFLLLTFLLIITIGSVLGTTLN